MTEITSIDSPSKLCYCMTLSVSVFVYISWYQCLFSSFQIAKYDIIVEPLDDSDQNVIAISVKPKSTYCSPCSENVHALISGRAWLWLLVDLSVSLTSWSTLLRLFISLYFLLWRRLHKNYYPRPFMCSRPKGDAELWYYTRKIWISIFAFFFAPSYLLTLWLAS